MKNNEFELLAPAGSFETFKAVIEAGADAVYVGGDMFGARAYANNFDKEHLIEAINYAHLRNRKVFLTVNTLLKNSEMTLLYDYLLPFYEVGLDAVLVQDFGALNYIHKAFPDLPIHTSTQMTVTGAEGALFFKEYGVERIVMAREVSLDEMKKIKEKCGLEIEAFVHGALCYSYSGQCLFSSILGGRSGNRGRCAQPCRLPYKVLSADNKITLDDSYILSLKDMCGIRDLKALKDAGVYSLKIEGRMKQPEYAAGVVAMYRKYIDSMDKVSDNDMNKIYDIGNRCGFSNSYYYRHNDSSMITSIKPSFKSNESGIYDEISHKYMKSSSKIEISGNASIISGKPIVFELSYEDFSVTVTGQDANEAKNKPMTAEDIQQRLKKMGDSPFVLNDLDVKVSENVFVPNGVLNQLRRDAVEALLNKILQKYKRSNNVKIALEADESVENLKGTQKRIIAAIENRKHIECVIDSDLFTDVYIDWNAYSKSEFSKLFKADLDKVVDSEKNCYLIMPSIFRFDSRRDFENIIKTIDISKITGFVVKNYEELKFIKEIFIDKKIILDHNMYTYNDISVESFLNTGVDGVTVPLELNAREISNRNNINSEMIIYGYYPLMTTAGCVNKNSNGCDKCQKIIYLRDRYNKDFPVKNNCNECYNTIYNSVPTVLFRNVSKLKNDGIQSFRFNFTIESVDEVKNIIRAFENEDISLLPEDCTNGHYKRGVE